MFLDQVMTSTGNQIKHTFFFVKLWFSLFITLLETFRIMYAHSSTKCTTKVLWHWNAEIPRHSSPTLYISLTSSTPTSLIFWSLMTDSFLYFLSVSSLQEASSSDSLLWSCWLLFLCALSSSWRSCSVCCWSLLCNWKHRKDKEKETKRVNVNCREKV